MDLITIPGLVDMHVHLREPGYEYKEDIMSGAAAAAAGGVTACCLMPNTMPAADSPETVRYVAGKGSAAPVRIYPAGAVTKGQRGEILTDFKALKAAGAVAVSDDGMPVKDGDIMRRALIQAREAGMLLISHCEPEAQMARRDVRLAGETGASLHIAHVSLAETVDIIRRAKDSGVNVTAETCPHYFSLTEEAVKKHGADACMNPPLRSPGDVKAIIEGLRDGTIDAIATDHAPHSIDEKALPPGKAPNGIIGLETSLAVTLTFLYHTGILTIGRIVELMSANPAKILRLDESGGVNHISGSPDEILIDVNEEWIVDPSLFKSKARNTPYAGMTLRGRVKRTICKGRTAYS